MMRQFFLENAAGKRYSFGAATGVYVSNPTGLGVSLAASFTDLGHGFFTPANADAQPQTPVCCDIVATGPDAYAQYTALLAFISAAGDELCFGYSPRGVEYLRRVKLTDLSKTELTGGRWLTCPATFMPLTPWYRPVAGTQRLETPDNALILDDESKLLDMAILIDSTEAGQNATIAAAGHLPTAVVLRYTGTLTNPIIRLVGTASGTEYGRCVIEVETGGADTLVWSTEFDHARVEVVSADGAVTDLLGAVDLAHDPFPRPATSEPLLVNLSSETALTRAASVTAYYYYRSV